MKDCFGTTELQPDQWYHMAITYDGAYIRVFVNGQMENEIGVSGPLSTSTYNLSFGMEQSTGAYALDGMLDEVRLWDVARTPEEIAANYNRIVSTYSPGLISYWNFDEEDGQYVYDQTGNGNNGILGATDAEGNDDPLRVISDVPLVCPLPVYVDIKPSSCPNPLNAKSKGKLPVAVLGTEDFDVTTIDPATIMLTREGIEGEVPPIRWDYEDVGTPFEGELCDCHDLGGDGIMDMILHFETQELVETLGLDQLERDTILPLMLTGNLTEENGGTEIEGQDCLRILRPPVGDMNNDLRVDWTDFSIFSSHWNQSNCNAPKWCAGADLSCSGKVNWEDFAILAENWLACTAPACD